MPNFSHLTRSRQLFRVELKRKAGISDFQNQRRKALEVKAQDADEAKRLALRLDGNGCFFVVDRVREIR